MNIDLEKIIPIGIPINRSDKLEPTGFINEFFLRVFETWFKQFGDFNKSVGYQSIKDFIQHLNDTQVKDILSEFGITNYNVDRGRKNDLIEALYSYVITSGSVLAAVVKYILNNNRINISTRSYEDYTYDLYVNGDLSLSMTSENYERIKIELSKLQPAHTSLRDIIAIDDTSYIETYLGNYAMGNYRVDAGYIGGVVGDDFYFMGNIEEHSIKSDWWWCYNATISSTSMLMLRLTTSSEAVDKQNISNDTRMYIPTQKGVLEVLLRATYTDDKQPPYIYVSTDQFASFRYRTLGGWNLFQLTYDDTFSMRAEVDGHSGLMLMKLSSSNTAYPGKSQWLLPEDMYSISNNKVTWNLEHPLLNLGDESPLHLLGQPIYF